MFLIVRWQGAQWLLGFGSNKSSAVQKADHLPGELRVCYLLSTVSMEITQASSDCIWWVTSAFIWIIFPTQMLSSDCALALLLNRFTVSNKVNLTIPFALFTSTHCGKSTVREVSCSRGKTWAVKTDWPINSCGTWGSTNSEKPSSSLPPPPSYICCGSEDEVGITRIIWSNFFFGRIFLWWTPLRLQLIWDDVVL